MKIRALRKAAVLLAVDIVIIIGIFVLQFRTDSNIIEKLGNFQLTFTKSDAAESDAFLNTFRLSYNGLSLYADEKSPVIAKKDEEEIPLTFINYEKSDSLSYDLYFSDDVKLKFALESDSLDSPLSIIAELPSDISDISFAYSYSSNMKLQREEKNQIVLEGKKNLWEFDANSLENNIAVIERSSSTAKYAVYTESQKFSLDMLASLPSADPLLFASNVQKFKNNIITSFNPSSQEAASELVVLAYISAMAEKGSYAKAIEDIPQAFKRAKQRTYLSAPYLDTLEEMNVTLDSAVQDYEKRLTSSSVSASLDVFMIRNIADFMYVHSNPQTVIKLLDYAASLDISELSLSQVTGILEVYVDLLSLEPSYARHLEGVLDDCIQKITECCSYDGSVLTVSENDTFLSVIQGIETGMALLRFAIATDNAVLEKAGYVMVNSYLSDSSFDIRTAANLYPIVAYDSPYYPHLEKIGVVSGEKVWAWTCARSITQELSSSELTLTIDFPLEWTHYVIIKGIPRFQRIYIYDMQFRTDPRFETYNSSGYVYKTATKTLLLKSRHKKQLETIRFELENVRAAAASSGNSASSNSASTSASANPAPAASTPSASSSTSSASATNSASFANSASAATSSSAASNASPSNAENAPQTENANQNSTTPSGIPSNVPAN